MVAIQVIKTGGKDKNIRPKLKIPESA